MSVEEEVAMLITFLSHPAGFDVGMFGRMLHIRGIDEHCPSQRWEVKWEELSGMSYKEFDDLPSAAIFFVELRHTMQLGLDFEKELLKGKYV